MYTFIYVDEINLYNAQEKDAGLLKAEISYDRVRHFEGELASGTQKQSKKSIQKVTMFKGQCATKNLFSILDPACEGQ